MITYGLGTIELSIGAITVGLEPMQRVPPKAVTSGRQRTVTESE